MKKEFDKYQLIERIGVGGMAEVYLAKSQGVEGFEKHLVIKRILPELSRNARFVEMFIAEARIAVALNHPNIVQIYDFGKVEEDFFLAMEYIDGWDLGYLVRGAAEVEPMAAGDVIVVGMEIARGLDYAHRRTDEFGESLGLVHRDISPQNVLVSRDGSIKIVDFGIAKASTLQEDQPNVVKGKFSYMSPEQARGDEVDRRSDLFSLGVVLFELSCGRPLFRQTNREQTLSLVKSAVVPDIRDLNPQIPEAFEHVLYKLLAREPEERYQSARELQQELMRVLYSLGSLHDSYTLSEYIGRITSQFERVTAPGSVATMLSETGRTSPLRTERVARHASDATTAQLRHRTEELGLTPVTPAFEGETDPGEAPREGEVESFSRSRKEVVLIAGVLEGLFALRSEIGQERWLQLFQEYTRMVDAIAFKNDGVVHRVNESGFMMLLGVPISSENDAERAARVALDMQDAMASINLNLSTPLKLAMGVAISEVILEQSSRPQGGHHAPGARRYSWSFLGDSHEFGEELARAGVGAEILLGSQVWRRIKRDYHCEAIAQLQLEVGSQMHTAQAWRLLRPKSWRDRLKEVQHAYHVLHGRELELRSLRGHYRRVLMENQACAVVLSGEQGVGKSTLVEEFLRGLDPRDVRVVRGVANSLEQEMPLGGVSTLLAELLRLGPREDLRQLRTTLETRIHALFPDEEPEEATMMLHSIGAIFGLRYSEGLFDELGGEERRKRTSLSLSKFLRRFAERKPVVLAIDDAHHLDAMTLELATQIFDARFEAPMFVVMALTPAGIDATARPHWERLFASRHVHREELAELGEKEARALVVELLRAQRIEDEVLVEEILRRAGGNPFYIKEVVEILRDRGVLQDSGERRQVVLETVQTSWLPTSVEGALAARLDRLPLAQRALLQQVALLWSPFRGEDVASILEVEQIEGLEALVSAGFLERVDEHRGLRREDDAQDLPLEARSYRFCNALTQEVAARSLLGERAVELHGRIAEHLQQRRKDEQEPMSVAFAAQLAHHLDGAGLSQQAATSYLQAAREAFNQFGAAESVKLCDKVLERLPEGADEGVQALYLKERALRELGEVEGHKRVLDTLRERVEGRAASERVELWLRLVRYYYDQADFRAALTMVAQVREVAEAEGMIEAVARADKFEGSIKLDQGRREEAFAALERAIAGFEQLDSPQGMWGVVACYNMKGALLRRAGRHQDALDLYRQAMAIAGDRLESDLTGRYLLINTGLALIYLGRFSEGLECYRRALTQARRLGHRRDEAGVLVNIGHAYAMLGDYDRAISHTQRGVYLARKTSATVTLADGQITLGTCYAETGQRAHAERVLSEGLRLAESIPHVYLAVHALLALARLKLDEGSVQGARVALMQAEDCFERSEEAQMRWGCVSASVVMASAYEQLGMGSRALELARQAWSYVEQGEAVGREEAALVLSKLLIQQGEEAEAQRLIDETRAYILTRAQGIEDEEERARFLQRGVHRRVFES